MDFGADEEYGRRTYQAEIKAPSSGPGFLDYFVEVEARSERKARSA